MIKPLFFLGSTIFCLASCKVGPDYTRPAVPLPASIRGNDPTATSLGAASWEKVFTDPVLQRFINEALANNQNLVAASYRIEEARAMEGIARSGFFPWLDGTASATRARTSQSGGGTPPGFNPYSTSLNVGALLSYEADIWGKIRRANEAARGRLLQSVYSRATVQSSLVAAVASTYIDLRAYDLQLAISRRTLDARKKSYDLVTERAKQGVSSDLEVNQAEVLLRQAEVSIPATQQIIALKENQLSLLLGRMPGGITRGRDLDALSPHLRIAGGLPSAVLESRPDILANEQALVAANADIGVAKAAYFPSLQLTGKGGFLSSDLDTLFKGASRAWSFTPSLIGPIFNAGRVGFGVKASEARQQQVLAAYQQSIQTAFREIADALMSYQRLGEVVSRQQALVGALQKVADLAGTRYDGGASSYLEVLDAQRNLFEGELVLTDAKRNRLQSVVEAYRAIGGGWQHDTP